MIKSEILKGIKSQDRKVMAKTMTIFESSKESDRELTFDILHEIEKNDYPSKVIGVTGTPGVGKSTFLNAYAEKIAKEGKAVAILTIDPSSEKTGGSILGDKTRMASLIQYENIFIRPSASGALLGGISATTRNLITLCEAYSYDYIFVESVGVGQSEVQLAKIVDFLFLFLAPGGGDDLQGIKKGVLEFTDLLVINKSDLDKTLALQTATLYSQSLERDPCVISALKGDGLEILEEKIKEVYNSADLPALREEKRRGYFWSKVEYELSHCLNHYRHSELGTKALNEYVNKKKSLQELVKEMIKSF